MLNKKILGLLLIGCSIVAYTTPSFAMMSIPYGWYVEANAGSAHVSHQDNVNGVNKSSSGLGGGVNAGYKFIPFLGIEVGYTQYPIVAWKQSSTSTKFGNDKYYSYDLVAKGILPMMDSGLEFFAKAGLGHLVSHLSITNNDIAQSLGLSNVTHSSTGLTIGGGLQYYFLPEVAVVAQWVRVQGNSQTGYEELLSGGLSVIIA